MDSTRRLIVEMAMRMPLGAFVNAVLAVLDGKPNALGGELVPTRATMPVETVSPPAAAPSAPAQEVATSTANPTGTKTRDRVLAVLRAHPDGIPRNEAEKRAACAPSSMHSLIRSLGLQLVPGMFEGRGALVLKLPPELPPREQIPRVDWQARVDQVVAMLRQRPMTRADIFKALKKSPTGDAADRLIKMLHADPRVVAPRKGGPWKHI